MWLRWQCRCVAVWVLALCPLLRSQNSEPIRLIGVGSTIPLQTYMAWIREYAKVKPEVQINYLPFGAGRGVEMVEAGTADFGDTEVPVGQGHSPDRKMAFFPVALGAVVPIYNLPGMTEPLRFTPQVLAGIYLGKITRWDDPAMTAANPGVSLPASKMVVIHGAEGRGSTFIWSDYLSKVSPEWKTRVGRGLAVKWPIGREADGSGNFARAVREAPNSIGYVELSYAVKAGLPYGRVQNAAGSFVEANDQSIAAATSAAANETSSDFRYSITNPHSSTAYPIASFTWMVIPAAPSSPQKQPAVKDFLRWILGDGQEYVKSSGMVRLPEELAGKERRALP